LLVQNGRRGRWVLWWLGAWGVLTSAGTCLHVAAARPSLGDLPLLTEVGNVLGVLVTPGWVVARQLWQGWPTGALGALIANGVGWALALGAMFVIVRAMRWMTEARAPGARAIGPPDSSRRRFLVQAPAALIGVGGVGSLVSGTCVQPWDLRLARYRVPIRGLPAVLDGLRIVQLSDTHLGVRVPASYLRDAVRRAIDLRPDLFALTGDYIHNGRRFIEPAAALFEPLIATGRPVVGVLGNHDWYGGGAAMSRELVVRGVHMLDNRRVWLNAERRVVASRPSEPALCIAGVGDLLTDWVNVPAALDDVPPESPRLLLSHNPDTCEAVAQRAKFRGRGPLFKGVIPSRQSGGPRVDLMLAGHTHGGQVRFPILGTVWTPSQFGLRYLGGLARGPGFPVVISRGVGMSIIPIRFGVPPEIVEVTLVRA
jgi:predicted MPP superfamily phosphohydrolase